MLDELRDTGSRSDCVTLLIEKAFKARQRRIG